MDVIYRSRGMRARRVRYPATGDLQTGSAQIAGLGRSHDSKAGSANSFHHLLIFVSVLHKLYLVRLHIMMEASLAADIVMRKFPIRAFPNHRPTRHGIFHS